MWPTTDVDLAAWIGHLGDTTTRWDNGFYVNCTVLNIQTAFLVDSGSTATLVSARVFQSIQPDKRPLLVKMTDKVRGANGGDIEVLGIADIQLKLGGVCFCQTAIVCDILPDGILGQDFMLRFASRIDYKKLQIETSVNTIPCWIGGEAESVSQVIIQETTKLPPWSCCNIMVNIPKADALSESGYLIPSIPLLQNKGVYLVEGIINTSSKPATIQLINFGETEATVFSNTKVGTCESFYDAEPANSVSCASIQTEAVNQQSSKLLPDHLLDLWERSKVNLTENEGEILADLLNRYQHIFSKSSEDLGRSDRVQHKINTGTAVPCRQPPRRQPIGKRDIEKQEV